MHEDAIQIVAGIQAELLSGDRFTELSRRADWDEALQRVPPFSAFRNSVIYAPNGQFEFTNGRAADWIVRQLKNGGIPVGVVSEAAEELERNSGEVWEVFRVHGVVCPGIVRLGQRSALMSHGHILATGPIHDKLFASTDASLDYPVPDAALVHKISVSRILRPFVGMQSEEDRQLVRELEAEREQILAALTLAISRKVELTGSYCTLRRPRSILMVEMLGPRFSTATLLDRQVEAADGQRLIGLLKSITAFAAGDELAKLRMAITRLNRSRHSPAGFGIGDCYIDLGIALELLLTNNRDGDKHIKARLAQRAAWLLDADDASTQAVEDAAKRLYTLRSTAVHMGHIEVAEPEPAKKGKRESSLNELVELQELVRRIILEILRRERFPEWPRFSPSVHLRSEH